VQIILWYCIAATIKVLVPIGVYAYSADELMPDFDRIRVLLHSNGLLHWEPGGIFRTTCDINIAYFPFDSQRCSLLIGAYSYYSTRMNITNTSRVISTHDFRVNGEWHIITTSAEWSITILSPPGSVNHPQHGDNGSDRSVIEHVRLRLFYHFFH